MKKIHTILAFLASAFICGAQTVTDADGNLYHTVIIGSQIWTGENLKTTTYNDGTSIPYVTDDTVWHSLMTPAYCWYNNDTSYKNTYGALYNWYAANTGKLCPTGWHVPSSDEWRTLVNFLGGENFAGGKLKEAGFEHWKDPNTGATDSVGFTALPGGGRDGYLYPAEFWSMGEYGFWWSSTEGDEEIYGIFVSMRYINPWVLWPIDIYDDKVNGYSIRCVSDETVSVQHETILLPGEKLIYPNPGTDRIYFGDIFSNKAVVTIYDLQGKQLISRQITSEYADVSSLSPGVYLVKIFDSNRVILHKFCKE